MAATRLRPFAEPEVAEPERKPGPVGGVRAWEILVVLLAPVAVFYGLRVRRMAAPDMIDPWFYTAYATHPTDLMARFGPKYYFWVRLGFIIPAHLSSLAFGPVGGFYVLRYLLALLAAGFAYLLFRRVHSRGAGAVAAALVLTSPVLLTAWGTDYPDSVAVTCLTVAATCAAMPTSDEHRWRWLATSATFGALAIHCQFVSAPLVAAVLVAHVLVFRRGGTADLVRGIGLFLGIIVGVSAALVLVAQAWLHEHDIFGPTLDQISSNERVARTPNLLHTEGLAWVPHVPYLLVPPAVLFAWFMVWAASNDEVRPAELVLVWVASLQLTFFVVLQFSGREPVLEYHLYSSMLWPSMLLLLAATVTRWGRRAGAPGVHADDRAMLLLAGVVLVIPLVAGWFPHVGTIRWVPWGLPLAVAVAFPLVAATWGDEAKPMTRATAAALALALLFPLSVAAPGNDEHRHARLPRGHYELVFGAGGQGQVDWYGALTQVPKVVGEVSGHDERPLYLWWNAKSSAGLAWTAGQYLWKKHAIGVALPRLTPLEREHLATIHPQEVLLLGASGDDFAAARVALRSEGLDLHVVKRRVIRSGHVHLYLEVLRPSPT